MTFVSVLSVIVGALALSVALLLHTRDNSDDGLFPRITRERIISSQFISEQSLLYSRIVALMTILGVNLSMLTKKDYHTINYLDPFTKKTAQLKMIGIKRFTTFTVCSWCLQGFYFAITIYATFSIEDPSFWASSPKTVACWQDALLYAGWVLYNISLPVALLVTTIVMFVLVPAAKGGPNEAILWSWQALVMHNINLAFMVVELIFNRIPFRFVHIVYMFLYGISYAIFAWIWYAITGVYYYFFLDYRTKNAVRAYLALFFVISVFFCAGYLLSHEVMNK